MDQYAINKSRGCTSVYVKRRQTFEEPLSHAISTACPCMETSRFRERRNWSVKVLRTAFLTSRALNESL